MMYSEIFLCVMVSSASAYPIIITGFLVSSYYQTIHINNLSIVKYFIIVIEPEQYRM